MSEFQKPKQPPLSGPIPQLPPARPQSLEDLMAHGEFFADYQLRREGRFPVTCFLLGDQGPVIVQPGSMDSDLAKDRMEATLKLLCVAHAATALVMVLEGWAMFATPEQPLDLKERPSEALARREVVMLVGESREANRQKILPILRTGVGSYFGLGDDQSPPNAQLSGRLTGFLPPSPPTAKQRRWAWKHLKGIGISRPG